MVQMPGAFVLIAEDDEDDYLLTVDALKEAGVNPEIHWVNDGEELLEYLLPKTSEEAPPRRPALILLDLNMPKKDGREALAEIKANPELRRIPVVVLTTSKAQTDIDHTYSLGVNSFMQKPASFNEYVDAIKSLLEYWFKIVRLPI